MLAVFFLFSSMLVQCLGASFLTAEEKAASLRGLRYAMEKFAFTQGRLEEGRESARAEFKRALIAEYESLDQEYANLEAGVRELEETRDEEFDAYVEMGVADLKLQQRAYALVLEMIEQDQIGPWNLELLLSLEEDRIREYFAAAELIKRIKREIAESGTRIQLSDLSFLSGSADSESVLEALDDCLVRAQNQSLQVPKLLQLMPFCAPLRFRLEYPEEPEVIPFESKVENVRRPFVEGGLARFFCLLNALQTEVREIETSLQQTSGSSLLGLLNRSKMRRLRASLDSIVMPNMALEAERVTTLKWAERDKQALLSYIKTLFRLLNRMQLSSVFALSVRELRRILIVWNALHPDQPVAYRDIISIKASSD